MRQASTLEPARSTWPCRRTGTSIRYGIFDTFTAELNELAEWLAACGVTTVAKHCVRATGAARVSASRAMAEPALLEATWAAVKENDSYLLKECVPYKDLGPDYFLRRSQEAIQRRCVRQLQQLGFRVTLDKSCVASSPDQERYTRSDFQGRRPVLLVPVHVPAQVTRPGLMHHPGHGGKIGRHVMLPAVQADITQQVL